MYIFTYFIFDKICRHEINNLKGKIVSNQSASMFGAYWLCFCGADSGQNVWKQKLLIVNL